MSSFPRLIIVLVLMYVVMPCVSAQGKLLLPIRNSSKMWGYCDTDGVVVIPHIFKDAQPFENGVAEVDNADWLTRYIDECGKIATRKEDLQSYIQPLLVSEKKDGVPQLIHRDGRVLEFPEFRYVYGHSAGCATGVTKDYRGAFSSEPLNADSWKCFSSNTSFVWYDEQSKILSYMDKGINVIRYQSAVGGDVRHLEKSVKKYDWSSACINSRIQICIGDSDARNRRYGVVSDKGKEILLCEYDLVDIVSSYILAWKYGDERKHSEVSFFDDVGLKKLSLMVDGDWWNKKIPSGEWYMFAMGGTNFWVGVQSKKKLHVEGDKVVVEQIQ